MMPSEREVSALAQQPVGVLGAARDFLGTAPDRMPLAQRSTQMQHARPLGPQLSDYFAPAVGALLGALPGSGDVMALQESQRAGQQMADAWRGGHYGLAAQRALESLVAGAGALPAVPYIAAIPVFHGSPHRFDKFDIAKIGTGEGAQAYGYGLYFAENPSTAGYYRNALSGRVPVNYDDAEMFIGGPRSTFTKEGARKLHAIDDELNVPRGSSQDFVRRVAKLGDVDLAEKEAMSLIPDLEKAGLTKDALLMRHELKAARRLRSHLKPQGKKAGALYNVRLDVEPEDLLDWDVPLSKQSKKVREALEEMPAFQRLKKAEGEISVEEMAELGIKTDKPVGYTPTGHELYNSLSRQMGQQGASRALAEAGIPGLRYYDAGSRMGGEGTRNIVMFDDKNIHIEGVD